MSYTRILLLLVLIPQFCIIQSSESAKTYFTQVIKQLKTGHFETDFKRVLHLAGPDKTVKDDVIKTLAAQTQCTLFRINVAQVVATFNPHLIHSYFQQVYNTAGGVLLCIDELQVLSLSQTYRTIALSLWTECLECLQACPNVFIIFTPAECRYLNHQFRTVSTCIKNPTLSSLPLVVAEPLPLRVPDLRASHEPIHRALVPTQQLTSTTVTRSHHKRLIKGLTAASVITGLWWLRQNDTPVRTHQLPTIAVDKPQTVIPEVVSTPSTWWKKIWPLIPRITTTVLLLADEISQRKFEDVPRGQRADWYNSLPKLLRSSILPDNIIEIPNSNRAPYTIGPVIFIGGRCNPLDSNPLSDELLKEFKISRSFLIAHQLAHIEFNDITYVLPIRMLITFAIPFALHAYDKISQKIFNATLNRLDPTGRVHPVLQRIQSIHSAIVCSPLMQTFVTISLKAAYQRHIESRAHTRALELSEIKTHNDCKIINSTLQRCAKRRANEERTLIERMHSWCETIPLCSPHVDSIPVPPAEAYEMQQINQTERRS
jgi:hypothetical protein